jgi:hypothetical protein
MQGRYSLIISIASFCSRETVGGRTEFSTPKVHGGSAADQSENAKFDKINTKVQKITAVHSFGDSIMQQEYRPAVEI